MRKKLLKISRSFDTNEYCWCWDMYWCERPSEYYVWICSTKVNRMVCGRIVKSLSMRRQPIWTVRYTFISYLVAVVILCFVFMYHGDADDVPEVFDCLIWLWIDVTNVSIIKIELFQTRLILDLNWDVVLV